jgi:C1A family cysteine protease
MDSPLYSPNRKYPIKIIQLDESKINYAKEFKPTNKICAGCNLPTKVDLREQKTYVPNNFPLLKYFSKTNSSNKIMPPVYDQGDLNSCTANVLCAAMQYNNNVKGARLFVYYNERKIENTIDEDDGAYLENGIEALKIYGVCQEEEWPYVDDDKKFKIEPLPNCYTNALAHKAIKVENIAHDLMRMKKALWLEYPIILAIKVYNSFGSEKVKKTGIVSLPDVDNDYYMGGHAILIVGYDDDMSIDNNKGCWICRNSYGTSWGDKGYFYIPYKYLLDKTLTTNLWIITEST